MKNFSRKLLTFTLSASLALSPAYAQASSLPGITENQTQENEQLKSVELSMLKDNLEKTLKNYLSEQADSLISLDDIQELIIKTNDTCPITVEDCDFIEKHLPNLNQLDVREAVFSNEESYLYFKDTDEFTYLYTENSFMANNTVPSDTVPETDTTNETDVSDETVVSDETNPADESVASDETDPADESVASDETDPADESVASDAAGSTNETNAANESDAPKDKLQEPETEQPQESLSDEKPTEIEDSAPVQGITLFSSVSQAVNVVEAVTSNTQTQATLTLNNASYSEGADIYFAVWSDSNGQDDIVWYLADQDNDSSLSKTIDIKNHHWDNGKYFVHVYENLNGKCTLLSDTSFNIAGISDGHMNVTPTDADNGIYRISVTDLNAPSGISNVRIPVWSIKNGQDDIQWYDASYDNGSWFIDLQLSNHNYEAGEYMVHAYAYDAAGHSKLCAYKEFTATAPSINHLSVQLNSENTRATITLSHAQISGKISSVYFPVWGNENGQNDIVWYKAQYKNGSWTAAIDLKNHSENGTFTVHAYAYDTKNVSTLLGYTSFNIPAPNAEKISVVNKDDTYGSYQVKIEGLNVPFGVSQVLVPTWTDKNGQDDILWYEAKKDGNNWIASIDSGNHNFETGKYISHIYVKDSRGVSQLLSSVSVDVKAADQIQLTAVPDEEQTHLKITLKNYRSNSTDIRFAVWGDEGGQNDIQWYNAKKAGNTYTYTVDLSKHKEIGRYNIHAYDCKSAPVLIRGISANVDGMTKATVTVDSQDNDYGKFTVKISGLSSPSGIQSIRIPVWSENNGQDDLVWYTPEKKGDNWYLNIDISNHKNDIGKYQVHVYATDNNGIEQLVGNTTVEMKESTLGAIPKVTYNKDNQTVTVTITNVRNASAVYIPVWGHSNGQNDIVWYTAKKLSSSSWETTIDLTKHKELGTYEVHIYTADSKGTQTLTASTTFDVTQYYSFSEKDNVYGTCKATINIQPSKTVSSVRMAVWTETNGQDDLHWYTASKSGNSYSAVINAENHNFESGSYNVHMYAYYADGSSELLAGTKTDITRTARIYQNPSQYYQIQDSITLSGGGYNLSYGYEGLKVAKVIQRLGVNGGNYVGMGGAIYGPKTTAAVKSFQSKNGLMVTGVVDLKTWLAMGFSEYDWYNLGAYVHPMKVNKNSTRSEHIEAMISTAYEYLGDPYVIGASGAPGLGLDCSGLVMQSLYAAGIDTSPINPVRHSYPGYEYESANMWASSKFKKVSWSERQRGDLIFYQSSSGAVIHVAIYLGNNQVIESWPNQVVVWPVQNSQRSNIKGVARPFV